MSTIFVGLPYQVGTVSQPLPIIRDLLGTFHTLQRDGHHVLIAFPRTPNDWLYWQPWIPGSYATHRDWGDADPEVSLYLIYVIVVVETTTTAAAVNARTDSAANSEATRVMSLARTVADGVVAGLIAWVRATTLITGLALSSDTPPLAGPTLAVEVETGEKFNMGMPIHAVVYARDPDGKYSIGLEDVERILANVHRTEAPPVAEVLLADAEALARHGVNDAARAVIMAAVACEVRVKRELRARVVSEAAAFLDYILDHPHEVTLTAVDGLFHDLCGLVLAASLKGVDRPLFNQLQELFRVRNRIVHYAEIPDPDSARRLVSAARRTFKWLASQSPSEGAGPPSPGG